MDGPELRYDDFDLLIVPSGTGGAFLAQVTGSPGGQCAGRPFTLPFSADHLEVMRLTAGARRGIRASAAAQLNNRIVSFGAGLFTAVFTGDILSCFQRSLVASRDTGRGLRIRLRVDDPSLADLPWEFLRDPEANRFLCLSDRTPLVRFLPLAQPPEPLHVDGPIRVLAIVANPDTDADPLDVEAEWAGIETATEAPRAAGQIILDRLDPPTLSALRARLRRHTYHVLHFVGHGRFNVADGRGELLFEDDRGRAQAVPAATLAVFLHDHPSLRLAVINACEGGRADGVDAFSGTAQTLIQQGIPAVVAMQFEITDRAAIAFATAFYAAIADGEPVDAATAQGRQNILTRSDIEWATPVVYTRATDTRIFVTPHHRPPPPPTQPAATRVVPPPAKPKEPKPKEPKQSKPKATPVTPPAATPKKSLDELAADVIRRQQSRTSGQASPSAYPAARPAAADPVKRLPAVERAARQPIVNPSTRPAAEPQAPPSATDKPAWTPRSPQWTFQDGQLVRMGQDPVTRPPMGPADTASQPGGPPVMRVPATASDENTFSTFRTWVVVYFMVCLAGCGVFTFESDRKFTSDNGGTKNADNVWSYPIWQLLNAIGATVMAFQARSAYRRTRDEDDRMSMFGFGIAAVLLLASAAAFVVARRNLY